MPPGPPVPSLSLGLVYPGGGPGHPDTQTQMFAVSAKLPECGRAQPLPSSTLVHLRGPQGRALVYLPTSCCLCLGL